MYTAANKDVVVKTAKKIDAAENDAATITIPADDDQFWGVRSILWSYDGEPTGGKCTVTAGTTVLHEFDITAAGPGQAIFENLLHNNEHKGETLIVTLAAAGSGVTGKLNIQYS